MFKKKFRLPKRQFKGERILSSPIFILKIAKNGKPFDRFGVVVSKKIDKRATVRNRIKRKFRSYLEEKMGKIAKGYDFLFIIKKSAENYEETLLLMFRKEGLLE